MEEKGEIMVRKLKGNKVIYSVFILAFIVLLLWAFPKKSTSDPGFQAARMGDTTSHGGSIVGGCPTVLIGGKPAARMGDQTVCPMVNPYGIPHVGGPIITGSSTVQIGGMPAARVGDTTACGAVITIGCPTVLIGD